MYNQSLPGTSMQQDCNLNAGIQIPAHIKSVRHFSKAAKKAIPKKVFDTVKHQLMAARYNNLPLISTNQRRNCPDFIETLTGSTVKLRQYINSKDCDGNTALMRAAIADNADYINMLLEAGADTEVQNKDGYTVLMIAADKGHTDCIKALTENADKSKFDIDNRGYDGNTALMVACLAGKTGCIIALAKAGADTEIKNRDGYTALMIAADINSTDDIKALKENTTTELTQNNLGISLIRAAGAKSTDCVNALLKAGAKPDFQNELGTTALFMAIKGGHIELIEVLRKAGANLNLKTKSGHTALTKAAQIGSVDCLKAIIKIFELRSDHLSCALIAAAKVNNAGCISLLLEAGANPNFQNELGTTALFMAIKGGH
ncbi:MAG: ankyrin repeat domain-containing protein, partial [Endozoicomonadaceae bacterium]|nr:ankyrin repeat domain-containing protein [Endozoicomonadaceae bacterium]